MRVLITGGSGMIGTALVHLLLQKGHDCHVLSRRPEYFQRHRAAKNLLWLSHDAPLPEVDAVIHLAGESVASLWTKRKKEGILRSRVEGTKALMEKLSRQPRPPGIVLSASAVGWYGDRPGETLTEDSGPDPQKKFRWEVCDTWEKAAQSAKDWGARLVWLRIGNVLDPSGGYLQALLVSWRLGLGLGLGSKESILSWIGLNDTARLLVFALEREDMEGPLNVTAPHPASQADLMAAMKEGLRPLLAVWLPKNLLRLFMGEFSQAVTGSQRILPTKAQRAGFQFEEGRIECLLEKILGR